MIKGRVTLRPFFIAINMIKIHDMKLIIFLFFCAFIAANLIVKHFGAQGLLLSSFLLIPFDFVCRCLIHEKLSGARLILVLFLLTCGAALATWLINRDAANIALGSIAGFTAAQVFAGAFYQGAKRKTDNYFFKVNISDLIAISFDSVAFQIVAFSAFNPYVWAGQIGIKFAGGLLWYFVIFRWLKLQVQLIGPSDKEMRTHLNRLGYYVAPHGQVIGHPSEDLPRANPNLTLKENFKTITEAEGTQI